MQFVYGLVILAVVAMLFTFCLGVLAPSVVFSLSTVAASFGILFIGLFLCSAAVNAVIKSLN